MSKLIAFLFCWSIASFAHAYVVCNNVPVNIHTSTTATFHNMHEVGVKGSVLFLPVSASNCSNSTGAPMASTVFIVIDNYSTGDELAKLRASMLLSAEASGKKINIHGYDLGTNSRGFQMIRPYFMVVNP